MSDLNQSALDSAVEAVKQTIAQEISELQEFLTEKLEADVPLSLDGITEIGNAVAKMSDAFAPAAPDEGRCNVFVRVASTGPREKMQTILRDLNCSQEQRDRLNQLFMNAVAAAEAQPAGGAEFETVVSFNDGNDPRQVYIFTNEAQKARFDLEIHQGGVALAQAQLDALATPTDS